MKLKNAIKDYCPLIMFFTFAITLFPFFYIFTQAWNELTYGIVLLALGVQLFFSVFFTIITKRRLVLRIIGSLLLSVLILVIILFLPIYYMNSVFYFGEIYSSTISMFPIALIFSVNAVICLYKKSKSRKYTVTRFAGWILCVALATVSFLNCLALQKTDDSVGVYCHNANQVICVQNLLVDCGEHAVQLNDQENSSFQGNNRVYANLIVGSKGISLGNNSSISDYNVFASKLDVDAMQLNISKKAYSLKKWQSMGFDTGSACVPVSVSLNPQTLLLTMNSSAVSMPEMPAVNEFMSGTIGSADLDYDFFATERKDGVFGVGTFATLPGDGMEISVDPRCGK